MKIFAVVLFCAIAAVSCDQCYNTAKMACDQNLWKSTGNSTLPCSAIYGDAKNYFDDLSLYATKHISRSFQYLLMSSHYGNHEKARDGFQKLYRHLSDTAWEDAINIIKYVTKRGGQVKPHNTTRALYRDQKVEIDEFQSLAKALDIQKTLAVEAHHIHKDANKRDPEVADYIEDRFLHRHAETVRKLSGYVNDVKNFIDGADSSGIQIYIFDEYLQKQL